MTGASQGTFLLHQPHFRHDECDRPNAYVVDGVVQMIRCKSGNEKVCRPCALTRRRNVQRKLRSGFDRDGDVFMLTLTAPSSKPHRIGRNGPWCGCTSPGLDLGQWNGLAGKRWNRLTDSLRDEVTALEFMKVVEVQARGAIHFHALVRIVGRAPSKNAVRKLALRHGFGHEVDWSRIPTEHKAKAAQYLGKYLTKSLGDRSNTPFVHPATGEIGPGRWHAHSSSRGFGLTLGEIRERQRAWASIPPDIREAFAAERAGFEPASAGSLDLFNGESYGSLLRPDG